MPGWFEGPAPTRLLSACFSFSSSFPVLVGVGCTFRTFYGVTSFLLLSLDGVKLMGSYSTTSLKLSRAYCLNLLTFVLLGSCSAEACLCSLFNVLGLPYFWLCFLFTSEPSRDRELSVLSREDALASSTGFACSLTSSTYSLSRWPLNMRVRVLRSGQFSPDIGTGESSSGWFALMAF